MASSMTIPAEHTANGPAEAKIAPEVMAAIAAAAAVFLGSRFRILSVNLQPTPHGPVNKWTRNGRTFIQASHNVRTRR